MLRSGPNPKSRRSRNSPQRCRANWIEATQAQRCSLRSAPTCQLCFYPVQPHPVSTTSIHSLRVHWADAIQDGRYVASWERSLRALGCCPLPGRRLKLFLSARAIGQTISRLQAPWLRAIPAKRCFFFWSENWTSNRADLKPLGRSGTSSAPQTTYAFETDSRNCPPRSYPANPARYSKRCTLRWTMKGRNLLPGICCGGQILEIQRTTIDKTRCPALSFERSSIAVASRVALEH